MQWTQTHGTEDEVNEERAEKNPRGGRDRPRSVHQHRQPGPGGDSGPRRVRVLHNRHRAWTGGCGLHPAHDQGGGAARYDPDSEGDQPRGHDGSAHTGRRRGGDTGPAGQLAPDGRGYCPLREVSPGRGEGGGVHQIVALRLRRQRGRLLQGGQPRDDGNTALREPPRPGLPGRDSRSRGGGRHLRRPLRPVSIARRAGRDLPPDDGGGGGKGAGVGQKGRQARRHLRLHGGGGPRAHRAGLHLHSLQHRHPDLRRRLQKHRGGGEGGGS